MKQFVFSWCHKTNCGYNNPPKIEVINFFGTKEETVEDQSIDMSMWVFE